MRWIEVTMNCDRGPGLVCADLAELGVGGMIVEEGQEEESVVENSSACWE